MYSLSFETDNGNSKEEQAGAELGQDHNKFG